MTRFKTWTLTDVRGDVWLDSFAVGNDTLRLPTPHDWSIRKRTLRGGLRDGVDLIEVHNGALSFSVLPTRGMGLWRGDYRGLPLGWRSPVSGPGPSQVRQPRRPRRPRLAGRLRRTAVPLRPGVQRPARRGRRRRPRPQLTLHGRIANLPAHAVEVSVSPRPAL